MWTVVKNQEDYEDWLEKCKFQYGEGSIEESVPCSYFPNSVRMVPDGRGYYIPTFFDVQDANQLLFFEKEMNVPTETEATETDTEDGESGTPAFYATVNAVNDATGVNVGIVEIMTDGDDCVTNDESSFDIDASLTDRSALLNTIQAAMPNLDPKLTLELATGLQDALASVGSFEAGQMFLIGKVTMGPEGLLPAADEKLHVSLLDDEMKLAS